MFVIVELETEISYHPDGHDEYKVVGSVYGSYVDEEEAQRFCKDMKKKFQYSDFEVRQLKPTWGV